MIDAAFPAWRKDTFPHIATGKHAKTTKNPGMKRANHGSQKRIGGITITGGSRMIQIIASLIALSLITSPVLALDSSDPLLIEVSNTTKKKSATRVMAFEERAKPPKNSCLGPVRVVGSQWATEAGAEESAQKAWMEQVRFDSGETFMDLSHAIMYQKRCSRSSIGEVVGQTMIRCEVVASPCKPSMVDGSGK